MYCKNCGKEIGNEAFCTHCGAATSQVETSQNTPIGYVPAEVKKWNWGAFMFNGFWGIGNKTYLPLLCFIPFFGFIWAFVCGAKGNEWAFKSGKYKPSEVHKFLTVQKTWNRGGLTYLVFYLISIVLTIVFVFFFTYLIFESMRNYSY